MDIDFAEMALSAFRVLVVGLVLGAGLPALFALGMRLQSAGAGVLQENATVSDTHRERGNPALVFAGRAVFAVVVVIVLLAVLWITRQSLNHYFGISIFGVGA